MASNTSPNGRSVFSDKELTHNSLSFSLNNEFQKRLLWYPITFVKRYMRRHELLRLHPEPQGLIYHNAQHSVNTALIAYELLKGIGKSHEHCLFLQDVGLLHDLDPQRMPGWPSRVPETLALITADFQQKRAITGDNNGSFLRSRLDWSERHLQMALAIIQRSEHPFTNSSSTVGSPFQRYRQLLKKLNQSDRKFVLEVAPLLSEYADKASWYALEPCKYVLTVLLGLTNELRSSTAPGVTFEHVLIGTADFLRELGQEKSFALDRKLAKEFNIDVRFPLVDEVFQSVLPQYGTRFYQNLAVFDYFVKDQQRTELPNISFTQRLQKLLLFNLELGRFVR